MGITSCTVLFCIVYSSCIIAFGNAQLVDVEYLNIGNADETPVQLHCNVTAETNKPVNYEWYYQHPEDTEDTLLEGASTSVFEISSVNKFGNYSCKVNNVTIKNFIAICLIDPTIVHTGKSITFIEGETDRILECFSPSYPVPHITWTVVYPDGSNAAIDGNTDDIYSVETNNGKSVVTISVISEKVRGVYTCNATNQAGEVETSVQVRVHSRLAPLWPALGILAEILIVTCIIFIVRRKSVSAEEALRTPFLSSDSSESSHEADSSGVRLRNSRRN